MSRRLWAIYREEDGDVYPTLYESRDEARRAKKELIDRLVGAWAKLNPHMGIEETMRQFGRMYSVVPGVVTVCKVKKQQR